LTVEHGFKSLWPAANKRQALFVALTINPPPAFQPSTALIRDLLSRSMETGPWPTFVAAMTKPI
jgi:hypothetical protein